MDQIICIFCGHLADIDQEKHAAKVNCCHCNRETELSEYKRKVDLWLESLK